MLAVAARVGDGDKAIPADQTVIWPARPTPALFLTAGEYRIGILNAGGDTIHEFEHTVRP